MPSYSQPSALRIVTGSASTLSGGICEVGSDSDMVTTLRWGWSSGRSIVAVYQRWIGTADGNVSGVAA